jgi:tetratricopeptide (TPR) repeat protein
MQAVCEQRWIAGLAVLSCLVSGLPRSARADQPPPPQNASAPAAAMARFDKGRAYFRAGRYREAIVELKAALELDPGSPVLRYNVAYTSELLGELPEAIEYYRAYLASLPRSARDERRRTRTTLRRLEGRRADIEGEAVGEVADTLFWVTLGGGAALLAGAGVTGWLALKREDEAGALVVGRDGSLDRRQRLAGAANDLALASDLLLAGGAALVVTSALLYFLREPDEPAQPATQNARGRPPAKKKTPQASLDSDGRGVSIHVRF